MDFKHRQEMPNAGGYFGPVEGYMSVRHRHVGQKCRVGW